MEYDDVASESHDGEHGDEHVHADPPIEHESAHHDAGHAVAEFDAISVATALPTPAELWPAHDSQLESWLNAPDHYAEAVPDQHVTPGVGYLGDAPQAHDQSHSVTETLRHELMGDHHGPPFDNLLRHVLERFGGSR